MKSLFPILSQTFIKDQSICILGNIRVLNILVFWEIIRSGDVNLLDRDHFSGKRYTDSQSENLQKAWEEITDEYFIAKDDERSKVHLRKNNESRILKHKINAYKDGVDLLIKAPALSRLADKGKAAQIIKDVYDALTAIEPRTKISYFATLESNTKAAENVLNALINKFNNTYQEKKNNLTEEMFDGFSIVATIENSLERSLGDLSTIKVAQFIAYEKQARKKELSKQKPKSNGR